MRGHYKTYKGFELPLTGAPTPAKTGQVFARRISRLCYSFVAHISQKKTTMKNIQTNLLKGRISIEILTQFHNKFKWKVNPFITV